MQDDASTDPRTVASPPPDGSFGRTSPSWRRGTAGATEPVTGAAIPGSDSMTPDPVSHPMRPLRFAAVAIPVALILSAVAPSSAARPERPATGVATGAARIVDRTATFARAGEIHRIRVHFDSVLTELAARDVAGLTGLQRARRDALVEILRAYRDQGEFPHNYDFPGEAVPYFIDRGTGVVCAVGHLLASSGRRDIVDRVAAMNNNVWVAELAGDAELGAWLDDHGLTLTEAARIQVPYVGDEPVPTPQVARDDAFPTGTTIALGASLLASYWNARPNSAGASRVANALGMIAGATALGAGASSIGDRGAAPAVGAASMIAGAASAWLSARNVMRYRHTAQQKREEARATVAPMMPIDGSAGAGVSITLRF